MLTAVMRASPSAAQTGATVAPPQAPAPPGGTTASVPTDPNPGAITLTGSFDVLNRYMFRGIRQNSTGLAMWPALDLAVAAYSGTGGLESVGISLGTWNSLHSGETGTAGPSGKLWYESDVYTTLTLGFNTGVSFAATYTAYTSPNNSYSTVKEVMVKFAVDDSARLGKGALEPYVILAREVDTAPGLGQADGGAKAGTYLELGIAPGYARSKASLAVPVKVGLSLDNYYELAGTDNRFGFFSIAGIVTVSLGPVTNFGTWNIHGGGEVQRLGATTMALNGGHRTQMIGSFGIGFSY
jgi:hypothetical protein